MYGGSLGQGDEDIDIASAEVSRPRASTEGDLDLLETLLEKKVNNSDADEEELETRSDEDHQDHEEVSLDSVDQRETGQLHQCLLMVAVHGSGLSPGRTRKRACQLWNETCT